MGKHEGLRCVERDFCSRCWGRQTKWRKRHFQCLLQTRVCKNLEGSLLNVVLHLFETGVGKHHVWRICCCGCCLLLFVQGRGAQPLHATVPAVLNMPLLPSRAASEAAVGGGGEEKLHCADERSNNTALRDMTPQLQTAQVGSFIRGQEECVFASYHPSLSAAFTLTPKSSRNLTMWWWPAHTALCRGVMPSSFGLLGSST